MKNFQFLEYDIYEDNILSKLENKFDIIFLDPPYKNKNLDKFLIKINNQEVLNENGIVIIHRHKNEQDIIPKVFQIVEQKQYGISKITFLTNSN
jgi:16S rRNA (guanine966-N2)-methyltransferase